MCCGFPPGSETDRNGLSMLSNELSPAQSPGSKVRRPSSRLGSPSTAHSHRAAHLSVFTLTSVRNPKPQHSKQINLHRILDLMLLGFSVYPGHGGNCVSSTTSHFFGSPDLPSPNAALLFILILLSPKYPCPFCRSGS